MIELVDFDNEEKIEENVTEQEECVVEQEETQKSILIQPDNNEKKNEIQMQYTNALADTRKRLSEIVDDKTFTDIGDKVKSKLTDENYVNKRSKDLEKVADEDVVAEIDKQRIAVRAKQAKNKADKQAIDNELYQLKQEKKRIIEFQKALNEQQKRNIKETEINQLWEMHGDTLKQYGVKKTNGRISARIILFFDNIKCSIIAMNKVTNKFMQFLKWLFLAGGLVAIYFILKAVGVFA